MVTTVRYLARTNRDDEGKNIPYNLSRSGLMVKQKRDEEAEVHPCSSQLLVNDNRALA